MCRRTPLTLAWFTAYTIMVITHERTHATGPLIRHVNNAFTRARFEGHREVAGHKTFHDIQHNHEVYEYLRETVLPQLLPADPKDRFENEGPNELNRVLRKARLIGGVQLQQKRWKAKDCSEVYKGYPKTMEIMRGIECYEHPGIDDCFGPLEFGTRTPNLRSYLPAGFCGDNSPEGYGQLSGGPEGPPSRMLRTNKSFGVGAKVSGSNSSKRKRRLMVSAPKGKRASVRNNPGLIPGLAELDSDTYSVIFDAVGGMPSAYKKLDWLEENEWIDSQTQWVGVNVFLMFPEMMAYVHAMVSIYITRGGEMVPYLRIKAFSQNPYYSDFPKYVDGIYAGVLTLLMVESWYKLIRALWKGTMKKWYANFWNLVFFTVSHGGFVVGLMWMSAVFKLEVVNDNAMKVAEWVQAHPPVPFQAPIAPDGSVYPNPPNLVYYGGYYFNEDIGVPVDDRIYLVRLMDLHKSVYEFSEYLGHYRSYLGFYGLVVMGCFFRDFQMQPRLAMVTDTIIIGWVEIWHHIVVMLFFWFVFAASGVLFFGRTVVAFATTLLGFMSCFRILLGDFDWTQLSAVNPELAAVWLFAFLVVEIMLLNNMFMAVVFDCYGIVKARALAQETLPAQIKSAIREYISRDKDAISASRLESIMKRLGCRTVLGQINSHWLNIVVPGMSREQARRIIVGARLLKEIETGHGFHLSHMAKLIGHCYLETQRVSKKMEVMILEMIDEQEENLHLHEMKKSEVEKRAKEIIDLGLLEDRWEPCRRFDARMQKIENMIARMERFCEDSVAWLGYRGQQVGEQVDYIESIARTRAARERERMDQIEQERMERMQRLEREQARRWEPLNVDDHAPTMEPSMPPESSPWSGFGRLMARQQSDRPSMPATPSRGPMSQVSC